MLTLIHSGEVYTPAPIGVQSLLVVGDTILKIGAIDAQTVRALGVPCLTIDVAGPTKVEPSAICWRLCCACLRSRSDTK